MSAPLNLRKLPGLWLIINNEVYDVSDFSDHPGGQEILKSHEHKDATEAFKSANHPASVQEDLKKYHKGPVPSIPQEELSKHNTEEDTWMAIHGKVYDVTSFTDHPGGHEILEDNSGKDASKAFDDIDHSLSAKEDLNKYFVGNYIPGPDSHQPSGQTNYIIPALILAVLAVVLRYILSN